MSKIIIPTPLRKFTGKSSTVTVKGNTVEDAVQDLASQYPALKQHLFDETGQVRSFIRIFVGDEDVFGLQREKTPIKEDSVISIVPAIAGG